MKEYLAAILPCNDLDETQIFFGRLGFSLQDGSLDEYRVLSDGLGGLIHLQRAVEGWLQTARNPFGLYLYREDVDGLAVIFTGEMIAPPRDTAWGMYEFAVNGPDSTLIRIGWPTRLRHTS
jgi:hypothetical protein